jgi:hypothetical protein
MRDWVDERVLVWRRMMLLFARRVGLCPPFEDGELRRVMRKREEQSEEAASIQLREVLSGRERRWSLRRVRMLCSERQQGVSRAREKEEDKKGVPFCNLT